MNDTHRILVPAEVRCQAPFLFQVRGLQLGSRPSGPRRLVFCPSPLGQSLIGLTRVCTIPASRCSLASQPASHGRLRSRRRGLAVTRPPLCLPRGLTGLFGRRPPLSWTRSTRSSRMCVCAPRRAWWRGRCGVAHPFPPNARQSVEVSIGMNSYQHSKVNQWSSNIVEQCLKKLTALGKPFKYIGALWAGAMPAARSRVLIPAPGSQRRDPAKERRGPAHGQLLLLGQLHRRCGRRPARPPPLVAHRHTFLSRGGCR